MAAILYYQDSLHMAILLAINISFLLLVALRLKSLDDTLVASVAQLKRAESSLALMVSYPVKIHGTCGPADACRLIIWTRSRLLQKRDWPL